MTDYLYRQIRLTYSHIDTIAKVVLISLFISALHSVLSAGDVSYAGDISPSQL